MISIADFKTIKKKMLARNVQKFLAKQYDWQVSKAVSNAQAVPDSLVAFRVSVITEYHNRVSLVDLAESIEQLDMVSTSFNR